MTIGESTIGTKNATRNMSRKRSPFVFSAWATSSAQGTTTSTAMRV
jgi:hypothetical protein